jgi:predicted transcriptional regulator
VSAARRDLIRLAVVERQIHPVDVSRFLGISTANVAEHLAAIRRRR